MKSLKSKALLYDDMKRHFLIGVFSCNEVIVKSTKNGRYIVIWKGLKKYAKTTKSNH